MSSTEQILSLSELKAHAVIDDDDNDIDLTAKREAARRHIEAYVGPLDDFPDEVPADIVEALKQLATHFYQTREAAQADALTEIPFGVIDLIGPYRKWEF